MIFGRKKDMVDIGELQRQGRVVLPENNTKVIETDDDGFIDASNMTANIKPTENSRQDDTVKLNARIQEMDRIIYKLEQRVELLERKLGLDNNMPPTINW